MAFHKTRINSLQNIFCTQALYPELFFRTDRRKMKSFLQCSKFIWDWAAVPCCSIWTHSKGPATRSAFAFATWLVCSGKFYCGHTKRVLHCRIAVPRQKNVNADAFLVWLGLNDFYRKETQSCGREESPAPPNEEIVFPALIWPSSLSTKAHFQNITDKVWGQQSQCPS